LTRILVVDDDEDLRLVTTTYLRAHGYEVQEARDAAGARQALADLSADVVVLDLGLPDDDGLNLVREIRLDGPIPVVVVSGRDAVGDRIAGLDLGADDYLVKPFSQPELGSRIRAVIRRSRLAEQPDAELIFGRLTVDPRARTAYIDGDEVPLTRLEYELLEFFARSPGRSFSHDQLLQSVWASSTNWQSEKTVSEHVYRLRTKLGLAGRRPSITTVRGVGYRFDT
jgi:DNA-binding response OmpR family regulator